LSGCSSGRQNGTHPCGLSPHTVLARETSSRFLILREAPTRRTHLALLRWSAARKTGCNRSRQAHLPWSDGTAEPTGGAYTSLTETGVCVPLLHGCHLPWPRANRLLTKTLSSSSGRPGHSSVIHLSVTLFGKDSILRIPRLAARQSGWSSVCMKSRPQRTQR